MHLSTWLPLRKLFQQRRFANLMELYEQNYNCLSQLAPGVRDLPDDVCSSIYQAPDLHLHRVETHAYTSDLRLTHYFNEQSHDGSCAEDVSPDLTIRIYHDSHQAEMLDKQWTPPAMIASELADASELERRWMANLFLERWLRFCVSQGYQFGIDSGHCARRRERSIAETAQV